VLRIRTAFTEKRDIDGAMIVVVCCVGAVWRIVCFGGEFMSRWSFQFRVLSALDLRHEAQIFLEARLVLDSNKDYDSNTSVHSNKL